MHACAAGLSLPCRILGGCLEPDAIYVQAESCPDWKIIFFLNVELRIFNSSQFPAGFRSPSRVGRFSRLVDADGLDVARHARRVSRFSTLLTIRSSVTSRELSVSDARFGC